MGDLFVIAVDSVGSIFGITGALGVITSTGVGSNCGAVLYLFGGADAFSSGTSLFSVTTSVRFPAR